MTTEADLVTLAAERNAKRVTPTDIEAAIKDVTYFHHGTLTIAVITMFNGYTVTGEGACADPAMYKQEVGEFYALEAAKKKIWPLLGFALCQELYEAAGSTPKDRVEQELAELNTKRAKLQSFIDGGVHFKDLSDESKTLLIEQGNVMASYASILTKRLEQF